jgi:hypothetical protein
MSRSLSVSTVKLCVLEYKHKTGFLKRNFINELLIMQKNMILAWDELLLRYATETTVQLCMPLPFRLRFRANQSLFFLLSNYVCFSNFEAANSNANCICMTRRDLSVIRECHGHFGWLMVFRATFNNISVISWRSVLLVEERPKIKYVCLRHPTDPIFSAAYPNLFIGNYSTLIFASDTINFYTYNPSKFSMDNAWTSNPTCANMTLEIPTSNKHRTSDAF